MISQALIDVLTAIGRLTYAEQSQLIQLIAGEQPSTVETAAKPEVRRRRKRAHKHWDDDETLMILNHIEDAEIMSDRERRRKVRELARTLDRSVESIVRKVWRLKNETTK
jgi:predicted transcriptional regulator